MERSSSHLHAFIALRLLVLLRRPDNASRLVWRGAVQERGFPDKFLVQSMASDTAARSFLETRGLAHYWDAAATVPE